MLAISHDMVKMQDTSYVSFQMEGASSYLEVVAIWLERYITLLGDFHSYCHGLSQLKGDILRPIIVVPHPFFLGVTTMLIKWFIRKWLARTVLISSVTGFHIQTELP